MIFSNEGVQKFKLQDSFLVDYKDVEPPWGFGALSYITFKRTYARPVEGENRSEEWWETCQRVIEGMFTVQKIHCKNLNLPWDNRKAQRSAQEAYDRMFHFKWLPPGRGLWAMGTDFVYKAGSSALNNCGFTSSEDIDQDFVEPFSWAFNMAMLGVGVGFDTRGAGKVTIQNPKISTEPHIVEDSREGWADAWCRLLGAFAGKGSLPQEWDVSGVRPHGSPIKGFGGVASGPAPLVELLNDARELLFSYVGKRVDSTLIVDLMNMAGRCVVAGGIRRTALVAFGEANDTEFMDLKLDHEKLMHHRWASNNSIFCEEGDDYSEPARRTGVNGEPGYIWMENCRNYGRMKDGINKRDYRSMGSNPCFSGDTKIAVADGRGAVSIRELAEADKDVPVYSVNREGEVEIKWARRPRKTRENARLIRITLDDCGGRIDVTPDHKMMLIDGTEILAKDLKKGDSIPRLQKTLEQITKQNPNRYIRVYKDSRNLKNMTGEREFEHRMIARFFQPDVFASMYDEAKSSGWIKGGCVVHHKDHNCQNNRPENLEWMTFRDHCSLHAQSMAGENNPMWGRKHSEETKRKIGDNTKMRWEAPEYREQIMGGLNEYLDNGGREEMSARMKNWKEDCDYQRWLEAEKETDLDTFWIGKKLFVRKICKHTGEEFTVPWEKRDQMFKDQETFTVYLNSNFKEKREDGIRAHFADKARDNFHKQVMIYKDLQENLNRRPERKEWEAACKAEGTPRRFNNKSSNPFIFSGYKEFEAKAKTYNHRVARVEELPGEHDVYNLTVDDNFTVGLITEADEKSITGIFTFQCLEQTLEKAETCCLVENFPAMSDSLEDFKRSLKFSYLYAKTVTLIPTHDQRTNAVMMRNRRIGCSLSGIAQNIARLGLREHLHWCDEGYAYLQDLDTIYSEWLCVPQSIKISSIKPSGTISLLAGATPGIHYGHSKYYIRRVRFAETSHIWKNLQKAGYPVEDDAYSPMTKVASFPICDELFERGKDELSIWEQVNLAALHQHYWADNSVSCTVTFKKEEAEQIPLVLQHFEDRLKAISFLPSSDHGYVQAPYETIDQKTYEDMMSKIKPMDLRSIDIDRDQEDRFCDGEACTISFGGN